MLINGLSYTSPMNEQFSWKIDREARTIILADHTNPKKPMLIIIDFEDFEAIRKDYALSDSEELGKCRVCNKFWEDHTAQELEEHSEQLVQSSEMDAG